MERAESNKLLTALAVVATQIFVGIPLRGWVITVLWGWFIVSTFGLPQLTLGQAGGLSLTLCFLRPAYYPTKDGDEALSQMLHQTFISIVVEPVLVIFAGWLVKIALN